MANSSHNYMRSLLDDQLLRKGQKKWNPWPKLAWSKAFLNAVFSFEIETCTPTSLDHCINERGFLFWTSLCNLPVVKHQGYVNRCGTISKHMCHAEELQSLHYYITPPSWKFNFQNRVIHWIKCFESHAQKCYITGTQIKMERFFEYQELCHIFLHIQIKLIRHHRKKITEKFPPVAICQLPWNYSL